MHKVKSASRTRCGTQHTVNQDSLLADRAIGLFIVADGMTGHHAGEIASSAAVRHVAEYVRPRIAEARDIRSLLEEAILHAHARVLAMSEESPDREGMGTTMVIALLHGDRCWIAHVGDSRAYLIADGTIQLLTHDHTFVADWLSAGTITPEEAVVHPARHGLYMAVGIDDEVAPDISDIPWKQDDVILLCTDGLSDIVTDSEILETIQNEPDPQEACRQLVVTAHERGETDDITAMLIFT
jgi:PPM family protein phosphatase